jgi:hypothetical protein
MFQPGYLPAQTLAGNVFIGSTTYAGVAIPAYNATAQVFGLWNPAGSGVSAMLVKLNLGVATVGSPAVSALGLSYVANAGAAIGASGAPVTAFAETAAVNGIVGKSSKNGARFTLAATTIAPTFFYDLALSQETTSAVNGVMIMSHSFDGCVIIPPNTYVGIGGSAAPGQTVQMSLVWMELPV